VAAERSEKRQLRAAASSKGALGAWEMPLGGGGSPVSLRDMGYGGKARGGSSGEVRDSEEKRL
jgi:hypothetical protein